MANFDLTQAVHYFRMDSGCTKSFKDLKSCMLCLFNKGSAFHKLEECSCSYQVIATQFSSWGHVEKVLPFVEMADYISKQMAHYIQVHLHLSTVEIPNYCALATEIQYSFVKSHTLLAHEQNYGHYLNSFPDCFKTFCSKSYSILNWSLIFSEICI